MEHLKKLIECESQKHDLLLCDHVVEIAPIVRVGVEIEIPISRELKEHIERNAKDALVFELSFEEKLKTRRRGASQSQVLVYGLDTDAGLEPKKGVNVTVEIPRIGVLVTSPTNSTAGITVTPTVLHSRTTKNFIPSPATLCIHCHSIQMSEFGRLNEKLHCLEPLTESAQMAIIGDISRSLQDLKSSEVLYERSEEVAQQLILATVCHASVSGLNDRNPTPAARIPTLVGLNAVSNVAHVMSQHSILSSIISQTELLSALLSGNLSEIGRLKKLLHKVA
jgi:glutamate carboxypeptidase